MTAPTQVLSLMVIISLGFLALAKQLIQAPHLLLSLSATSFFAKRRNLLHSKRRNEARLAIRIDLENSRQMSIYGSQHYYLT
jgi:hypothetical protein